MRSRKERQIPRAFGDLERRANIGICSVRVSGVEKYGTARQKQRCSGCVITGRSLESATVVRDGLIVPSREKGEHAESPFVHGHAREIAARTGRGYGAAPEIRSARVVADTLPGAREKIGHVLDFGFLDAGIARDSASGLQKVE